MTTYRAPLAEYVRLFSRHSGLAQLRASGKFSHVDPDVVTAILSAAADFAEAALALIDAAADAEGSHLGRNEVHTPEGFKRAYALYS